jgi:hypothetical protein
MQPNFFDGVVLDGEEWVETINHQVFPDGTRFRVIETWHQDYLLCWKDGIQPPNLGTLIKKSHTRPISSK